MGKQINYWLGYEDFLDLVKYEGGMRVSIHAKDGAVYSFNTTPAKNTLDALEKMGVPVRR